MLIEVLGVIIGATAFVVGFEAAIEQNEVGRVEDRLDAFRERVALDPPSDLARIDTAWEGFSAAYMPDLYRSQGRKRPLVFLTWMLLSTSVVCVIALTDFRGTFTRSSVVVAVLLLLELVLVLGGWKHRRHLYRRLEEGLSRVGFTLLDHVHETVINPLFLVPDNERDLQPNPDRVRAMEFIYRWSMSALRQTLYAEKSLRSYWDETKLEGFDDLVGSYYLAIDVAGSYLVGNECPLPRVSVEEHDVALILVQRRLVKDEQEAVIINLMTIEGMPDAWLNAWRDKLLRFFATLESS